jgi:hypothetical protein
MLDTFTEYNQYAHVPDFSKNIIHFLLNNNEIIWKLLKYATPDALSKPNLTKDEKSKLIYAGVGDEEDYRVFTKPIPNNAVIEEQSQLRVFLMRLVPLNDVIGHVDMCFQIISHNNIEILDTYQNRNEVLLQQVIATLNGQNINGITNFGFYGGRGFNNSAGWAKFGEKWYSGYQLVMSCKESTVSETE